MATKTKKVEFWAIAMFYNFMVMGGDVNQLRSFKLEGEPITIKRFKCYLVKFAGKWNVYEKVTGGLLGDGKTKQKAIEKAEDNIKITPDLRKQMKAAGKAESHREIDTEEAERRLLKSK